MREATARARAGVGPTLIEAKTYRTVGHHEGDPVIGSYRTQAEVDAWATRCPVAKCRRRLGEDLAVPESTLAAIEQRVDDVVSDALEFARNSPEPDPATVGRYVLAEPINPRAASTPASSGSSVITGWLDAVRDGIAEEMRQNPHILYFGEGKANLDLYRASAINFLNTADNGTTIDLLRPAMTAAAYDSRIRGMVAMLMTLQRFQEQ